MVSTFTFADLPMPQVRIADQRAPIHVEFDNWRVVVDPDCMMDWTVRRYAAALVASAIIKCQLVTMQFGELPQLDELRRMAELERDRVDFYEYFNLPFDAREVEFWPTSWLRIDAARN
jgi:hypothetical protein